MPSRNLLVSILLLAHFLQISFTFETDGSSRQNKVISKAKRSPVEGFYFQDDQWTIINSSPHLHSFQSKNGLDQLHLGRKPFFKSVVPTALELHRTLFQQIASESAIDWQALGIEPGDQRLHQAEVMEVWPGRKVALDVIPIYVNSQKQHYAIATFSYRNHPVYFASRQFKDLITLKQYLESKFTLR